MRTPGPAGYSPDFSGIHRRLTYRYSFGTATRPSTNKSGRVPGPAQYDLGSQLHRAQCGSFTRSSRNTALQRPSTSAGPGSYNVDVSASLLSTPKYGYVEPTISGRFGSSQRPATSGGPRERSAVGPGPGSYNVGGTVGKDAPRAIVCSRPPVAMSIKIPGPGAYETFPAGKDKSPAYRIATSPRLQERMEKYPGPADYTPKDFKSVSPMRCKYASAGAKTWNRIGKAKRIGLYLRRNIPGPGAYTIKSLLGGTNRAILIGKGRSRARDLVPGPGQYTVQMRRSSPAALMGSAKKQGMELNLTSPGPAAYNCRYERMSRTPKYSFGTGRRNLGLSRSVRCDPGPGDYMLRCTFANVPRYSMMKRDSESFQYV